MTAGGARRRTPPSKLVSVLVGLALIVASAVGYRLSLEQEDFQIVRGRLGELHRYNDGLASVSDIRVGTKLEQGGASVDTPGLFVVVRLTVQAPNRLEVHIQNSQLLAGGDTTYDAFSSGEQAFADPGFETSRDVAFEVSPERIDDLTVQVWDSKIVDGYHQRFRVHLGITEANAAQWVAAAQGQVVEMEQSDETRGLP